jgi:hypothetical protein
MMLICPFCGEEVEPIESFYMEFIDDSLFEDCGGYCPGCDRQFTWTYKYVLVDATEFTEVGPN